VIQSIQRFFSPKIFFGTVAFFAFLVLCKIHYSDGDDAFFDSYAHSMNLVDYLQWRYVTWTGRLGAESVVFGTFTLGIWFWRFVNAIMVAALPACLYHILKPENKLTGFSAIRLPLILVIGYLLMDIMTFGHAAIWVNGSIFYTWAIVAALIILIPFFKYLKGQKYSPKHLIYSIPLSLFAVTSIEQIGFSVICIWVAGLCYKLYRKECVPKAIWIELAVFIFAFAILYFAPGNASRIATETENWYPQFAALSIAEHSFITLQWMLSSFANEGKALFILLWLASILSAPKKLKSSIPAALFIIAALLPFAKIELFSDIGLNAIDPAIRPETFPSISGMSLCNWVAFTWWSIATVFTGILLWNHGKAKLFTLFILAIATEALMYFSPTIYASGERVFYIADWILLGIAIHIWHSIQNEKHKNAYAIFVICIGILNAVSQVPIILSKLG